MSDFRTLRFSCLECTKEIAFALSALWEKTPVVLCPHCQHAYDFGDPKLQQQLEKFANLCGILRDSEEILSEAAIGVDVGPHQVQIPFRLLLTRLGAKLDLLIGKQAQVISFRFEPAHPVFAPGKQESIRNT